MANTALLQAVTQMLMQGRPPSPIAAPIPAGGFSPPGGPVMPILEAPIETAPIAPPPARDDALIALLSGTPPVAPTPQPDSLIQQISRLLLGVSAGVEGRGPQFLAGLQEQRERPQREFRAATEQFEDRRRRATVFAEEKQQRGQADIQRQANIQSDRDFQMRELETRDRMQEARDLRQQAALLEREERKAQAERQKQEEKDARDAKIAEAKAVKERQEAIRKQADVFMDDFRINRSQAIRFARHEIEGVPLTGPDQKTYARIEKYRAPVGGGSGSTGPVMAQLEDGTIVPLSAVGHGDQAGRVVLNGEPLNVVGYVGGRIPARPQTAPAPTALLGGNAPPALANAAPMLFGARPTAQATPFSQGQGPTDAEVQEYAQIYGVTPQVARKELAEMKLK